MVNYRKDTVTRGSTVGVDVEGDGTARVDIRGGSVARIDARRGSAAGVDAKGGDTARGSAGNAREDVPGKNSLKKDDLGGDTSEERHPRESGPEESGFTKSGSRDIFGADDHENDGTRKGSPSKKGCLKNDSLEQKSFGTSGLDKGDLEKDGPKNDGLTKYHTRKDGV